MDVNAKAANGAKESSRDGAADRAVSDDETIDFKNKTNKIVESP